MTAGSPLSSCTQTRVPVPPNAPEPVVLSSDFLAGLSTANAKMAAELFPKVGSKHSPAFLHQLETLPTSLGKLGFSDADFVAMKRAYLADEPTVAQEYILRCLFSGTPLKDLETWLRTTVLTSFTRAVDANSYGVCRLLTNVPIRFHIDQPNQVLPLLRSGNSPVYQEIPAFLVEPYGRVTNYARYLALFLPEPDHQEMMNDQSISMPAALLPAAFAYLRFCLKIRNSRAFIHVDRIESPYFARLRSPHLKERYQNWERSLLRGLETFIARAYERRALTQLGPGSKVEIVLAAVSLRSRRLREIRREEAVGAEFDMTQSRRRLSETAQLFAGSPCALEGFKLVKPKNESVAMFRHAAQKIISIPRNGEVAASTYPVRWAGFSLTMASLDVFSADLRECVTRKPFEIYPLPHRAPKPEAVRGYARLAAGFTRAPANSITAAEEPSLGCAANQVVNDALDDQFPRAVLVATLDPNFTLISSGINRGISSDWWRIPTMNEPGWHVDCVHLKTQNRHPSIRFFQVGEDRKITRHFVVGIKGGGIGSIKSCRPLMEIPRGDIKWLPFLMIRRSATEELSIGGGLRPLESMAEYAAVAALHVLTASTAPELSNDLVIPYDLQNILHIPVAKGGGTEWISTAEYFGEYTLDRSMGSVLHTFRNIGKSDVRLNALINRIFDHLTAPASADHTEIAERINSALQFLYLTHNETYKPPSQPLPAGSVGHREILCYLTQIYEDNKTAADRIYSGIERRTYALLGLVHGAGGHLGGNQINVGFQAGAFGGGSTAPRNIDLAGSLHDFGVQVFLPWSSHAPYDHNDDLAMRALVSNLQAFDVSHLEESLYWFRRILMGETGMDIENMSGVQKFEPKPGAGSDIVIFAGDQREGMEMLRNRIRCQRLIAEARKIIRAEDPRDVYSEYVEKGRTFKG